MKTLHTDIGGKFISDEFEKYLKKEGVKHGFTIPKCPEQSRVAGRLNRTLVEIVQSMLANSFLAEVLATATYLLNKSPIKAVEGKSPYEAIYGVKSKVGHFRAFACTAYKHSER